MPSYYTGNYYLNLDQMKVNVSAIHNVLYQVGFEWTLDAQAALMGNAQQESTINPGIWQNLVQEPLNGFGLFHWTPSTTYTDWCTEQGFWADTIEAAIFRIDYELQNNLQYIPTPEYPISFHDFLYGDFAYDYLAKAWLHNYERPKVYDDENRVELSRFWYSYLNGEEPVPPEPPEPEPESGGFWWIYYMRKI